MSLNFCFIGAGNLATHLATELNKKAGKVVQVYSRKEESARMLAEKIDADFTTNLAEITSGADVYFFALKDSLFSEILTKINFQNKALVHCSGSLPLSVLNDFSDNTGVFYPLQTFSKNRSVNFSEIPVFVEASNKKTLELLLTLAGKISEKVAMLDSEHRKRLHISAVFACNFVNHLYTLAADFLESESFSFEVLHPLIAETTQKALEMHPAIAQTGPAIRYDQNIINDHLAQLVSFPELKELYSSISKSIFERHQK